MRWRRNRPLELLLSAAALEPGGAEQDTESENDLLNWPAEITEREEHTEYRYEIERRLNWEYPYIKLEKIPAKVTVTELKRKFEKTIQELERQQQRRSLDHRNSFLSTRSLSNRKQGDEETMSTTIASTIKRNFLSSRPFLTTSLTSLDLKSLSNKKRNASLDAVHFTESEIKNLKQTAHSRSSPNVNTDTDTYSNSKEWKEPCSSAGSNQA